MAVTATESDETVMLRVPGTADAREIMRLVRESRVLDRNSDYAYLLLCEHFRETCVIAESAGRAVGFTAAYLVPLRPHTLFVWQIAVSEEARGQGLAGRMLDELIGRPAVRYLEATVTPSNTASRALFAAFARRHTVNCEITPCFSPDMFSDAGGHEGEDLFRIGPFPDAPNEVRSAAGQGAADGFDS